MIIIIHVDHNEKVIINTLIIRGTVQIKKIALGKKDGKNTFSAF